jgi:hypothetical protein
MVRFALAMTLVEIALTVAATLTISLIEPGEPYVTEGDLRDLRIPCGSVTNTRTKRFDGQVFYESRAELRDPPQTLFVSLRTEASDVDFDHRLNRERQSLADPKNGAGALIDEPMPGERGYMLRHRGNASARTELVRLRDNVLLVVRVSRPKPYDSTPDQEVVKCERRARVVELRLLEKLGWRE